MKNFYRFQPLVNPDQTASLRSLFYWLIPICLSSYGKQTEISKASENKACVGEGGGGNGSAIALPIHLYR